VTTEATATPADTTTEPLWMVCRNGGDVKVRWEDLTEDEQQDAHRHHNKIYGVQT
jgi:hypothetical protein